MTKQNDPFAHYEIVAELGKDDIVTTYKAIDRKQNRPVVIKILAHDKYKDEEIRVRVQRKLQKLGQLHHTYIKPILSAREADGNLFWIEPFFKSRTLTERLETETFTRSEAQFIRNRLEEALSFAHERGIYHQNLQSDTVLFDEVGNLYLTDFNLLPATPASAEQDHSALARIIQQVAERTRQTAQTMRPHIPAIPKVKKRYLWLTAAGLLIILLLIAGRFFPRIGATVSSPLRSVVGNQAVARLQTVVFRVQDQVAQWRYGSGLVEPVAPWPTATPSPTTRPTIMATELVVLPTQTSALVEPTLLPPTALPLSNWMQLTDIAPLGTLPNEGVWEPYITDDNGNVLAQRTFLQPDAERPLTIVGIVAFDLAQVRLNYVLGTEEPARGGTGEIKIADRAPNKLLATFNGGFMSTHGNFGAMADGKMALPPRAHLATVAIDKSSEVYIGAWNEQILPSDQWKAYRQNARLIIVDGEINLDVYSNEIADWGGTIDNEIVTWRSALGLNEDRDIMYYVVGSGLSMPTLADTLLAVETHNAMLLDINAYWVHFTAVRADGDELSADPLFPDTMNQQPDRYLTKSERDFFYITRR